MALHSCAIEPDESNNPTVRVEPSPVIITEEPPETSYTLLAQLESNSPPQKDPLALAQRLLDRDEIPAVVREIPLTYRVGDEEHFWISNADTNEKFRVTASLAYITPHLYMWVEKGSKVDQEALERSAKLFEEQTYPTNHQYFGSEWSPGIDSDVHLSVLHTRRLGKNTGGYFFSTDEYSHLANEYSNEQEMFYVNLDTITVGSDFYDGVLAHEFQHMIHFHADPNEDLWLNEGLSVLAASLNNFDIGMVDTYFLSQPDIQLNAFDYQEGSGGAHYGASFLFARYLLDRYGKEAIQKLVEAPENGFDGIEAALGVEAGDLYSDWVAALYLDRIPVGNGDADTGDSLLLSPSLAGRYDEYPVRRTTATVHQFGTDYILFSGNEPLTLVFTGTQQVKLLNTAPHGGDYFWWSNRGEYMDSTLTRAFDLSGLEKATLEYWVWYETEEGWDYAYLEVSADGGRTWETIETGQTTGENPSGNNYGDGYTGISGGGDNPAWIHESVNLDEYAGQPILIRFETITDGAITYSGLALDDVSIPELGFSDGFEKENPAWEGAGFIRCNNSMAQEFAIQLIVGENVRRLELDEHGRGRWEIPLSSQADRAVLAISGVTPVTLQVASYAYQADLAGRSNDR